MTSFNHLLDCSKKTIHVSRSVKHNAFCFPNTHRTVIYSLWPLGTGQNTRNFLFVEDVARAFEVILFKGKVGMVYNIGEQILLSLHSSCSFLSSLQYSLYNSYLSLAPILTRWCLIQLSLKQHCSVLVLTSVLCVFSSLKSCPFLSISLTYLLCLRGNQRTTKHWSSKRSHSIGRLVHDLPLSCLLLYVSILCTSTCTHSYTCISHDFPSNW